MTVPAAPDLAALLHRTRYLLLDFDGPICSIFAGHPASVVASDLMRVLIDIGAPLPAELFSVTDPFEVLRHARTVNEAAAERIEARLQAAELEAVETATPTPRANELVNAFRANGGSVAVVSNNSVAAITRYLQNHTIDVDLVVGRTTWDPDLLKPNPRLLACAISTFHAMPDESAFVGDSTSDVVAARQLGVPAIGFANKPRKRQLLESAGAVVVVDDLSALVSRL